MNLTEPRVIYVLTTGGTMDNLISTLNKPPNVEKLDEAAKGAKRCRSIRQVFMAVYSSCCRHFSSPPFQQLRKSRKPRFKPPHRLRTPPSALIEMALQLFPSSLLRIRFTCRCGSTANLSGFYWTAGRASCSLTKEKQRLWG